MRYGYKNISLLLISFFVISCGSPSQNDTSQKDEYESLRMQCNLIFKIYNDAFGGEADYWEEQGKFNETLAAKELVFVDSSINSKIREYNQAMSDNQDAGLLLTQIANYCDSQGIKP
jgi:hypothetical protein